MQILNGMKRRVENLSFSPDGVRLAAGGVTGPVEVWDTSTGERTHSVPLTVVLPHTAMHFHPDGTLFVGGIYGLRRFNLASGTHEDCFDVQYQDHTVALAPDGSFLIVERDGTIAAFACREGYPRLWEVPIDPLGFTNSGASCFRGFAVTPDGKRFVAVEIYNNSQMLRDRVPVLETSGPNVSAVVVHDCATGRALQYVLAPFKLMEHPTISPDDSRCVLIGGRSLYVFRTDNFQEPPAKLTNDVNRNFTGLAFHPGGKYLAATSNDATVKLFDTATWEIAHTFTWKLGKMRAVAFSPDGLRLAAGAEKGQVVIWDADL